MSTCEYNECKKIINSKYNKYCVFYAPTNKKGASGDEFNKLIFDQINCRDYNFEGYIFPTGISFEGREFDKNRVKFKNAKFMRPF